MMTAHTQYTPGPASAAQDCHFWSARVDALESHLSTDTWALAVVTVAAVAYPIARIVILAVLHGVVPDIARTVFKLI
jgi:hypothetical protein